MKLTHRIKHVAKSGKPIGPSLLFNILALPYFEEKNYLINTNCKCNIIMFTTKSIKYQIRLRKYNQKIFAHIFHWIKII